MTNHLGFPSSTPRTPVRAERVICYDAGDLYWVNVGRNDGATRRCVNAHLGPIELAVISQSMMF